MSKKSTRPELFSKRFNIPTTQLDELGVFDLALNVDTLLFPDPLLLERSAHREMRAARKAFDAYFEEVMALLHGIREDNDKAWRTAFKYLSFPEIKGTCLGYGSASISGSGTGPKMTTQLIRTGRDIVRMGIDDPDLFMAMGLFEEDFGPDLIGDMFTNIAFSEISEFNQKIISKLGIPHRSFDITLANGNRIKANFAENLVCGVDDVPVILMPKDILRDLPIATSWGDVQKVAAANDQFREGLNQSVAHLWSKKTLQGKDKLKQWAMSNAEAFGSLLDILHGHDGKPYDFIGDPNGEVLWRQIGDKISKQYPLKIAKPQKLDEKSLISVVDKIVNQFIHLIEDRDLWRELYVDIHFSKPRLEKSSQRLFYMSALSYCDANDLDISPEAETGRGPVDFKLSQGAKKRVLVEMKLSTNTQVVKGFEKQLAIYNAAEKPIASYYVVLNVGNLARKLKQLEKLHGSQLRSKGSAPNLIIVDALPKKSASKVN